MATDAQSPFTSIELRWFLDGGADDNRAVKRWFEEYAPLPRTGDVAPVEWAGRLGDAPDIYLLLRGQGDVGIKLREELFQVKGLVADLGERTVGAGHVGRVQRWIKWSYIDGPVRRLFTGDERGLVEVGKTRAVRLIEIEGPGKYREVASSAWIEQGVAFEMTDLVVGGSRFSTIAFEAFPDSQSTRAEFDRVAGCLLDGLSEPRLGAAQSMSYPAWLNSVLA